MFNNIYVVNDDIAGLMSFIIMFIIFYNKFTFSVMNFGSFYDNKYIILSN